MEFRQANWTCIVVTCRFSTLAYISTMKNLLFTLPKSEMKEIYTKQKKKEPEPLTAQFSHRLLREDAIKQQKERQQKTTELFPSGTFNLCSQEHLVNN